MGKIPERSIFDSQPNVRENNIVSVAHCMYWIWLVYSRSHSSQQYKSSITCGNSFSLNFHQNKKIGITRVKNFVCFVAILSIEMFIHRRKSRQWKEWQLLIDALGFSFSVIVLSMCVFVLTHESPESVSSNIYYFVRLKCLMMLCSKIAVEAPFSYLFDSMLRLLSC